MENNKSSIKISVIMLTYNREAMIVSAIKSVILQTFKNFEFIIVDNGSSDNSGILADVYTAIDNRIRVIHRERGTIGSGRNTGLHMAKGEYVTFIDDDDWCEPDYLEFLYDLAIINQAEVSICGAYKEENGQILSVGSRDKTLCMNAEEAIIQLMWRKHYNTGFPTKLIKKELFHDAYFAETGKYEDISLMYRILAKAHKVIYYGQPKYHVYRHDGNNSSATTKDCFITPEYLAAYRTAYRNRTLWLCEKFPNKCDYWWYFDWSFQLSMISKIISNNLTNCDSHLQEMKRELKNSYLDFIHNSNIQDFERNKMELYIL